VSLGIAGNLAGYPFLDPIAAAIVRSMPTGRAIPNQA
jgi:hypothetical protein